jgi:mitochondrial fission protein ELM1
MNSVDRRLQVWLLSDGKPGHYTQSEGLLRALAKDYPMDVRRCDLKLRSKLWRPLLRLLLNSRLSVRGAFAVHLLRIAYKGVPPGGDRPDLVVSCGGDTVFANALLGRTGATRNVFLGTLRGLWPAHFAAVVTGLHIDDVPNQVELTLSPGSFDRDAARARGLEMMRDHRLDGSVELWALLFGGDGAGYRYAAEDIDALCELLRTAHERYGIRWLLSTSRRSGEAVESRLRAFIAAHPEAIARAVIYGDTPEPVAAAFMGAAQRLFISEESSSMLSEAMLCRIPVVSLAPSLRQPNAHYARFLHKHRSAGRLCSVPLRGAVDALESVSRTACGVADIAVDEEICRGLAPLMEQLGHVREGRE